MTEPSAPAAAPAPHPHDHELAYWRDMIDRTDRDLRKLIAKRMSCAREVARIKAQQAARAPEEGIIYYRPGREAQMMRHLAREGVRQAGDFPVSGLIQIWRELISASIEHQANGLRVAVSDPTALAVARAHFGASSDIRVRSAPLDDLAAGKVLAAVLPWHSLADDDLLAGQHLVAALPFVGSGQSHAVIAAQPPEPSGDDRAVYALANNDGPAVAGRYKLQVQDAAAPAPAQGRLLGLFATPLEV